MQPGRFWIRKSCGYFVDPEGGVYHRGTVKNVECRWPRVGTTEQPGSGFTCRFGRGNNLKGLAMKRMSVLAMLAWLAATPAAAHDPITLDQLLETIGSDFETAEITTQKVGEQVSVLFGLGGNIAVSVGSQGVLIVDDQFPELMPRIKEAIEQLGGGKVDFAINTPWHFDHASGHAVLGEGGTWLFPPPNFGAGSTTSRRSGPSSSADTSRS